MTEAQDGFYWKLWGMLRKAEPGVDRRATHAALNLPDSHGGWNNAHFDKWKAHCLAKAQPANYVAQVKQIKMPAIRQRVFVAHLLAALEREETYAEAILTRMNRYQKQGGPMVTLDTLDEHGMKDLVIALKMGCRRQWRTKAHLLGEIYLLSSKEDFDETRAREAVLQALCWKSLQPLDKMVYEALLVVLSVLRRLASGAPLVAASLVEEVAGDPDWTV